MSGVLKLSEALKENKGLTSLNLDFNQLCGPTPSGRGTYTTEGITKIAEMLTVNTTLQNISLAENYICAGGEMSGLTAICDMLKTNSSLRELKCTPPSPMLAF